VHANIIWQTRNSMFHAGQAVFQSYHNTRVFCQTVYFCHEDFAWVLIMQAEHDTPLEAPDMRKPLALKLHDCRLAVDLDSRNALWAMSEHMFAVYQLMKSMPVVVPAGATAAPAVEPPSAPGYEALVRSESSAAPEPSADASSDGGLRRSSGLRRRSLFGEVTGAVAESGGASVAAEDAEDGGDLLRLILAQREVSSMSQHTMSLSADGGVHDRMR